jgi:hypothetical protein
MARPCLVAIAAVAAGVSCRAADEAADEPPNDPVRLGMVGLDTSHCPAFAKLFNVAGNPDHVPGCRVVAAHPWGSRDIESSRKRIPGYTEEVRKLGVAIVDDLDDLPPLVDVVLLETNDGRPHLAQAVAMLRAGKPLFIDKPVAGSLADAVAIYRLARRLDVPIFSCSSLRYLEGVDAVRAGKVGTVLGCDAYSPCVVEPSHPDFFWYGIHGCELLFAVMGTGCRSVVRTHTADFDQITGTWDDGRIGTVRGIRAGTKGYGFTAFGSEGIHSVAGAGGYRPLVVEIARFARTGEPPVSGVETLEIYAFMEAADESRRRGGVPVTLAGVLERAETEATARLEAVMAEPEAVAK